MDEKDLNGMEQDDEIVVFEDDDGNEYNFRTEEFFFYNGEEYVLLSEIDEESACEGCSGNCDECGNEPALSCIVCKVVSGEDENGEETETFEPVQDTEFAERLFEIADNKLKEDEEE